MEDVALLAEAGRVTGSAASRRLRAQGKVPAVLYGHGTEPIALAVDRKELRAALTHEAGLNALITLKVGDARHLAMARQLQRAPVGGSLDHVDFVVVRRDEIVAVEVPVRVVGEAIEVERADGLVEQLLFSLLVHATPANIPPAIEVDVTNLTVGDSVRVSDLSLPEGAQTEMDPEEPVVIAQAARAEEELGEGGETAEGAATEPASGQDPTGGTASEE